MSKNKTVFQTLSTIDVSGFTRELRVGKKSATYLSWSHAWREFCKACPTATYKIVRDSDTNLPYVGSDMGAMVFTEITVDGITHEMWLPILDGANKAMKKEVYTYKVIEWANGKRTGNFIDKEVEAFTMFDVNTSIMRCLVKNMAMFGLGINIYAGEDLPMTDDDFLNEADLARIQKEETNRIQKFNELTASYVVTIGKTLKADDQDGLKEILAELAKDLALKNSVWKKLTPDQQQAISDLKKTKQVEVEKKELPEEAVA